MRTPVRVLFTLCLVALAVFAGYHLWVLHAHALDPRCANPRRRGDRRPDVSGWVRELKVADNQQVKAGELLLSIDRDRFEAALEKAQAVVQTRQQQLSLREHEASRRAALGPQAISAELRENAQINAGIARGELRQAQAEAKVAELNLARSQVRAPRDGHITNLRLAEGNYVNAGQSVMALVDDSAFYVQAYFEETKLPRIKVGDPVKVWLMSAGDALQGHVQASAAASPTAMPPPMGSCWPRWSRPSTGCAWPSGSRCGSSSTRCRRHQPERRHDRQRPGRRGG